MDSKSNTLPLFSKSDETRSCFMCGQFWRCSVFVLFDCPTIYISRHHCWSRHHSSFRSRFIFPDMVILHFLSAQKKFKRQVVFLLSQYCKVNRRQVENLKLYGWKVLSFESEFYANYQQYYTTDIIVYIYAIPILLWPYVLQGCKTPRKQPS